MKVINSAESSIMSVLSKQYYNDDIAYKKIKYLIAKKVEEGVLLCNLLTCEIILISDKDYDDICCSERLKKENPVLYYFMVTHWYYIPIEQDEKTIAYNLKMSMKPRNKLASHWNSYTIFTTTDCNARCFYCYEKGCRTISMTEQTALDIAKFIEKKRNPEKPVRLGWFGGEPLFNAKVIDIICNYLKERNIDYYSTMISNAYLFDMKMCESAKNEWNLHSVQITLDGLAETYNKAKSYIYKDSDAFGKVITNIHNLISVGVKANIRLNVSAYNIEEMRNLVEFLNEEFANEKEYFKAYIAPLFEGIDSNPLNRTDSQRTALYEEIFKIENLLMEYGIFSKEGSKRIRNNFTHCMADNPNHVVINPEGKLGRCEHYSDSELFGSIYDNGEGRDYSVLERWSEPDKELSECKDCFCYPRCVTLKLCPAEMKCNAMTRMDKERQTIRTMENAFKHFKKKNPEVIDKFLNSSPATENRIEESTNYKKSSVVVTVDKDGNETEYKVLCIFPVYGRQYIALSLYDDEAEESHSDNFYLYRAGNGFEEIFDDEEYEIVVDTLNSFIDDVTA